MQFGTKCIVFKIEKKLIMYKRAFALLRKFILFYV